MTAAVLAFPGDRPVGARRPRLGSWGLVVRLPSRESHASLYALEHGEALVERMASRGCGYGVIRVDPGGGALVWARRSPERCIELAGTLGGPRPPPWPGGAARVLVVTPVLAAWLTLEQLCVGVDP